MRASLPGWPVFATYQMISSLRPAWGATLPTLVTAAVAYAAITSVSRTDGSPARD